MIIMVTQWYPLKQGNLVAEKFLQALKNPLPSYIKKWQTFSVVEDDKNKVYNLIMVEKGKADDAQIEIGKILNSFSDVDGYSMKLEIVLGARDTFKILGRSL
ncbi:MAG: hypothetical protein ACFFD7_12340 [Candidatus Thorarchaeota archaeon]